MADTVTLWTLIRDSSWTAITALGGVPLVVGGIAGLGGSLLKDEYLAGRKAELDRRAATYGAELKRQELIFNKRVKAAAALSNAVHAINVADDKNFYSLEKNEQLKIMIIALADNISAFRAAYAPILPAPLRQRAVEIHEWCIEIRRDMASKDLVQSKFDKSKVLMPKIVASTRALEAEVCALILGEPVVQAVTTDLAAHTPHAT